MKARHLTFGGDLYRVTRAAEKALLMEWANSGKMPALAGRRGITWLGEVERVDDWTLREVEEALLRWLREGRQAPAREPVE